MSSPVVWRSPPASSITLNPDERYSITSETTKEELEELYKLGYRKFIEGFSVHNARVRYYCNKTLAMRQPMRNILDDLCLLNHKAMAFIPGTVNHYILSTIFTLIEKTTNMINWKKLNRKCFWDDYCREARQLRFLINQAQVTTFECLHTAIDKYNRAREILRDAVPLTEGKGREPDPRLIDSKVQAIIGGPTLDEIKVIYMKPRESVTVQWRDVEENEIQNVNLNQTCDSFKLRFLRALIHCARKSLEQVILTISRVDVVLRAEFPLEKLAKCDGLTISELVPNEQACLQKSKREFDGMWRDVLETVYRFRSQLDDLNLHVKNLKRLAKDPKFISRNFSSAKSEYISIRIEDPLLLGIVTQAIMEEVNNESYYFTMYTDRNEDIIDIIGDMWRIDKTSYKTMDLLIMLIYSSMTHLNNALNNQEKKEVRDNLLDIYVHRDRAKRYLKKALGVFSNHHAFNDLPINQQTPQSKDTFHTNTRTDISVSGDLSDSDSDEDDGTTDNTRRPLFWIHLPGGFDVAIGENNEFLVLNHFKDQSSFRQLNEEQQVNLTNKMIARLFHFMAAEGCFAKILHERSLETKSLVKRLKPRDRVSKELVAIIAQGNSYIKQLLRLMKNLNVLRKFSIKE